MSGQVPALADGFSARPETDPGVAAALVPGAVVVLAPGTDAAGGARDWLISCGKTQLAASCAQSLWQSGAVDLLVWIPSASRASVLSGYVAAAVAAMGISPAGDAESVAARFAGWLSETSRPWLMVLDGLSDAADLAALWPAGPAGRILITTAEPEILRGEHGPGGLQATELAVGGFSTREALSYLMGRLNADPDQRRGAIDLVADLGGEPLALAQASAVIASSGLSCREFRGYFGRRREKLAATAGELPVAAVTWTFSFDQAGRLAPGGAVYALLALAAQLDGNGIPAALFAAAAVRQYLAADAGPDLPGPGEVQVALHALERAGLLTADPPAVRMSPAVQAAVRAAMPAGLPQRAALAAAAALLEIWPADESQPWLTASLRACAASLQRAAGDALWADGCHPLLLRTGQSLDSARLTGPAVAFWRHLAETSDRINGPAHLDTLMVCEQMAAAYLTAGRAAEAVPWFKWALAARIRTLGPDDPGTIAARRRLGHAMVAAGDLADALSILAAAAGDYERVLGSEDPASLSARDEVAAAYLAAGQPRNAIRLQQQTLADRERVLGSRHPGTMAARHTLADAFLADGKIKDAMAGYKKTLSDRERALGRDHLDTIAARGALGTASHAAGRMGSALQLFEQTRADYERVLGAAHPDTLAASANLAHAYYAVGRVGDATARLRDTLARCDQSLSPGDPLTHKVRQSLLNIAGQ